MSTTSVSTGNDDHLEEDNSHPRINEIDFIRSCMISVSSKLVEKIRLETLRPLPMFLGMTDPTFCFDPVAFTPPAKKCDKSTMEKIFARLSLNFSFFLVNYVLVFMGVAVVVSLMHLHMLFALAMLISFWWFHFQTVKSNIPLKIGSIDIDKTIPVHVRTWGLIIISALVSIIYCLLPFLCILGISALLIFSHALLRDPKNVESSMPKDSDVINSSESV